MKIQIEEKKPIDVPSEWCSFEGAKFLIAGTLKPAFGRKMEIFSAKINQELNGYREISDESAQMVPLSRLKPRHAQIQTVKRYSPIPSRR